jgi:hypothetical protein
MTLLLISLGLLACTLAVCVLIKHFKPSLFKVPFEREVIIIDEKRAISHLQKTSRALVKNRDLIDLMDWWMLNELPTVISTTVTTRKCLFDVAQLPNYRWMHDQELKAIFAKALHEQGFYLIGPDDPFGRTLIGIRSH